MARPRHYSPAIRRDLVTKLYFRAKDERIPMTKLVNRLIDEAMIKVIPLELCRVAETTSPEPPHAV
jgi:hypothetical protein